MAATIGSTPAPTATSAAPPTGGLRQQLAQAQSQLSACLTCASVNTPQTQAQIANLTVRVKQLESRIQDAQTGPSQQAVSQVQAGPTVGGSQGNASSQSGTGQASIGGNLDLNG